MRILALIIFTTVFSSAFSQELEQKIPPQEVDQYPEFPGGQEAMMKYLEQSIQYPQSAKDNGVEGTVQLTFNVNADGSISDVFIVRGVNEALNNEAIRVIEAMPHWKPGKSGGQAVQTQMRLPIQFKL